MRPLNSRPKKAVYTGRPTGRSSPAVDRPAKVGRRPTLDETKVLHFLNLPFFKKTDLFISHKTGGLKSINRKIVFQILNPQTNKKNLLFINNFKRIPGV
ncbi:hypothetical protein BpHYR1_051614 [Brachionus plicatilis]|uniref:Uncharacterized protein n=1 Tax=Brachionus plicatilis TaxID=10195 RepID=A0A3M7QZF4_BRAPC|nr:hypothetical protein BpHYR1_051614 [Brachionus plicatilis]